MLPDVALLLACFAGCILIATTPAMRWADAPVHRTPSRIPPLDGLRGFLAIGVLLFHGSLYRHYAATGRWEGTRPFLTMVGFTGVFLFFMVTGFLFWSRLIAVRGRIDWIGFFIARIFRIGPIYLLAVGLAVAAILAITRRLAVPADSLLVQIAQWSALGLNTPHPVNGYDLNLLLAGVTWSLWYEWMFYFSLPVLALLTRFPRAHLPAAAAVLVGGLVVLDRQQSLPAAFVALFGCGMLAASLQAHRLTPRPGRVTSILAAALLVWGVAGFDSPFMAKPILLDGAAFTLISSGTTLFGALTTRAAQRLGNVSYGIYLLQGLVLAAVFRPPPLAALAVASPVTHALMLAASGAILAVVATMAHAGIERPCMQLGNKLARQAQAWRGPGIAAMGPS